MYRGEEDRPDRREAVLGLTGIRPNRRSQEREMRRDHQQMLVITRGRKSIITATKTFSRDEWLEGKSALTNWADLTEGARSNNNTEQREEEREKAKSQAEKWVGPETFH